MSSFFDLLERYWIGLTAALSAYVIIFMYLQMHSFETYVPIEPFHDGSYVDIPEDEIELKPENILMPQDYNADVKNMSRDANDQRERSYDDYYENAASGKQMEQSVYDLEKQMLAEAGGAEERARIQQQIDDRKQREKEAADAAKNNPQPANLGGDKAYAGNVMVEWVLSDRSPHQKNNWYVRNPGYTCGKGASGLVTVIIHVNQSGNVTSAEYDPAQSSGANSCMIEQAKKYALMSRFSYSGSAPKSQTGRISYTFVSQ